MEQDIIDLLHEYLPQGDGYNSEFAHVIADAMSEIARLRDLLNEAADDIQDWGGYASDYFKEKHDLAGCVAKYRLSSNVV